MTLSERVVDTPHGPARLVTNRAPRPVGTLLLGHGAGGGVDARDLVALATHLPRHGFTVVRLEQPWKVAGKRIAPAPRILDEGLVAASDKLRVRTPLIVGGRSAGARSAVRCGRRLGAVACLALAFPLHPPGKPESSRLEELRGARLPTLVVQGDRDTMGRPEEFPDDVEMVVVPGGDHGFKVPARGAVSQDEAMDLLVESTLEWLVREVTGNQGRR
ncbi:alpha/beta family hydrolase [Nocardioides marmotae]|uniref:Hydrolase n=1 Tax=Nocardioides marmotae TaxID=2663857 RepID=A0A6I3JAX3_9ACTN|nr:alpha/beta family hydrolase [Nocardioides marmotae]MCR6031617.1 hydrolase [Gordonia jinghuaiqii]MBC9733225.1 hydrolase [Nocardioides marmotae]MTB84336.1 hydrolase [Nocardioides marmotae]MTB95256.1 hydrolase [Nocardioides marmotae]QKE02271.1 hydrolase [Nocardioides marmotae]